jgi:hypothetical protein
MKTTNSAPLWSKEAQKKMIDMNMSKKELAKELKCNYNQLVNVMSGIVINNSIQERICTFLKITL